jgi:hypothetical protein
LASQVIHNSYQSALPAPLSVTASAGVQAQYPVPAVQTYAAWDDMDGMTGIGPELAAEVETISASVNSSIINDCRGHLGAANFFENLLLKAGTQFASLKSFVTTNHAQSLTVSGDKEEAHRFTMEMFKGVFREVHKIRCKAADRTGIDYTIRDAGRSFWAALQASQLIGEMAAMGFTGHPLLAPYTVSHLYRHRVARQELTSLDTKIRKLETEARATDVLAKKLKQKHGV